MLRQYIVYGSFGAICIEDDSIAGAIESVKLSFYYPELVWITCVKEVFICGYPY